MPKTPLEQAVDVGIRDREIFDWPNVEGAFSKLQEEVEELKEVLNSCKEDKIFEEFSDVFFTLLQVARHLKINPEENLSFALKKYDLRYQEMFKLIEEDQKNAENLEPEELESYWQKAKSNTNSKLQKVLSSYLENQ